MDFTLTFRSAVEAWHDYYLLAGTAAATLMGLLFVSLSIHLERVVAEDGRHLEAMAREAFASFLIVLFISLMLLAPTVARRPLGVSMIALGILRGALIVARLRPVLGGVAGGASNDRRSLLLRFGFPLVASIIMLWSGIEFLRRHEEDAMAGIMLACILLLADATRSAYELLVRTARTRPRG